MQWIFAVSCTLVRSNLPCSFYVRIIDTLFDYIDCAKASRPAITVQLVPVCYQHLNREPISVTNSMIKLIMDDHYRDIGVEISFDQNGLFLTAKSHRFDALWNCSVGKRDALWGTFCPPFYPAMHQISDILGLLNFDSQVKKE